jgi:hypothetical protein
MKSSVQFIVKWNLTIYANNKRAPKYTQQKSRIVEEGESSVVIIRDFNTPSQQWIMEQH